MKRCVIAFLATVLFLYGCDFEGGLIRFARLEGASLRSECIQKALDSVEGLSDIRYSQPGYYRGKRHRFDYTAAGIENNLIYEGHSGQTYYWNGYSVLNSIPEREDLHTIRPYLVKIDEAIERECNTQILHYIEEQCSRMDCN
jgi:hypothetical protein